MTKQQHAAELTARFNPIPFYHDVAAGECREDGAGNILPEGWFYVAPNGKVEGPFLNRGFAELHFELS